MKKMTRVERKKRNKKILGLVFVFILLITLSFQTIKRISFFNVKLIKVTGNKLLTDGEIIGLSEIKLGDNIFDLSLVKARKNIGSSPYVKEVRTRRVYPTRVNLHVEERDESFKIPYGENKMVLTDRTGRILRVGKPAGQDAVLLKNIKLEAELSDSKIGERIEDFIEDKNIRDFFKNDSKNDKLELYNEIDFKKNDIKIVLKTGQTIDFGSFNNMDYKFRLLEESLDYIKKNKIAFERIIMNRGDNPIIIRDKEGG